MCNWKKWFWPGILTVALMSAFALWMKTEVIQDDLRAKSEQALTAKGYSWAAVEMDGRDAIVTGLAPDETGQIQSAEIVDSAYDVRIVENRVDLMAAQLPYVFTVEKTGNAVVVTGFVPNQTDRVSILAAAKDAMPSAEITDRTELARGAPDAFSDLTGFGFEQLAGLKDGRFSWSDKDLTIVGTAPDRNSYNSVRAALADTLPAQSRLAESTITPPLISPYTWAADYDGNQLVLSGHVSSLDARNSAVQSAGVALPSAKIIDKQLIASGAPKTFDAAIGFGLEQLTQFSSGSVSLSDLDLTVRGVASDAEAYRTAKKAVADKLPDGMELVNANISPATISPYRWAAHYKDSTVSLTGFVPDMEGREAIIAAARSALPGASVNDQMQIAAGAPQGFSAAAMFALQQLAGFSSGSVALSNLDFTVQGISKDSELFRQAKDAVSGVLPAGMTLARERIAPPVVSPYRWSAEYDGAKLLLEGFVPNDASRGSINRAAKAALPKALIEDRMEIAAGAPKRFAGAAGFALRQLLRRMTTGSASLDNLNLTIKGAARSSQSYLAVKKVLAGDLPSGLKLVQQEVAAPAVSPYIWRAKYDGRKVVLTGHVPDEAMRESVNTSVEKMLPGVKIEDRMLIATGAPDSFGDATAGALVVLPQFTQGEVTLTDLDLTVKGKAISTAAYPKAETYLAGVLPGAVRLKSSAIQPPEVGGEYLWQATLSDDALVLEGSAPSREARAQIEEKAKEFHPRKRVDNRMLIETGAPDNFTYATGSLLELLNKFSRGSAGIRGTAVDITGDARTVVSYETALNTVNSSIGTGFKWQKKNIRPAPVSPYSWSIEKRMDKASIAGFVPDTETAKRFAAEAKVKFQLPLEDQQRVGGGAPKGFKKATQAVIASVALLENAKGTITDTNIFVEGRAASETEAKKIGSDLAVDLPSNYKLRKQITFPVAKARPEPKPVVKIEPEPQPVAKVEPAQKACDVDFNSLFKGEKIRFQTARAVVLTESAALLERIARGAKNCEGALIEVGGHTDSRGTRSYNQGLSDARASAVVAYLRKQGVPAERLVARGYGESRPIASNRRARTREKNRRIEFKVLAVE